MMAREWRIYVAKVSNDDDTKKRYPVQNPHKYLGDPDNVIIRSSWEARVFDFCDNNQHVLAWASEEKEFVIPYMKPHPTGGYTPANYFPDLYIEYVDRNGDIHKEIFEVKPKKFTKKSRSRKEETKNFENYQYIVNMAKFQAAELWCKQRGYKFNILSEDSIFRN